MLAEPRQRLPYEKFPSPHPVGLSTETLLRRLHHLLRSLIALLRLPLQVPQSVQMVGLLLKLQAIGRAQIGLRHFVLRLVPAGVVRILRSRVHAIDPLVELASWRFMSQFR